jgi:acyl carrier protein phosphodiesterase
VNFLAHLFLSGDNTGIKMGNFIADFVKGNSYLSFPTDVRKGIILHRKIDTFTDSHALVKHSKSLLYSKYHKYAGIIVDIFYDHFLAVSWKQYADESIEDYIDSVYIMLHHNFDVLPLEMQQFIPNFIKHDWLRAYLSIDGVKRVLNGMTKGTSLPKETDYAIEILNNQYHDFENDFLSFFPELIDHVRINKVKFP